MKAMAKHRTHSIEFKRQIAQDFIAGETLHALASRHDISRNLIRIWVRKFEAGASDGEAQAADLLQDYEAKIAALERMVGRQALEIECVRGGLGRTRTINQNLTGPALAFRRAGTQSLHHHCSSISARKIIVEGTGLPPRLERQCGRADKGCLALSGSAPLAMTPLWGFGGDGA
jgi:transposase